MTKDYQYDDNDESNYQNEEDNENCPLCDHPRHDDAICMELDNNSTSSFDVSEIPISFGISRCTCIYP